MPVRKIFPSPRPSSSISQLEDQIWRLKNDLFVARAALLTLNDPQDLMDGYYGVKDLDQLDAWREERAKAVIAEAWVRPGEEMGDPRWPRALCPLCRQGAQGARDVKGYAVPEGLRRHLLGELNSRQCHVFGAAESIAKDGIRRSMRDDKDSAS